MHDIVRDFSYAARVLLRARGFTLVAVATLAEPELEAYRDRSSSVDAMAAFFLDLEKRLGAH
jgi:hypothetical protein